ncbi:hypothetical protein CLV51_107176 [Chitinophaga niastensis]|uniref:Uncharacterized protein n=1 Tax=Chitinophaga niastensis TaxID=536980 RepID=A0A2P8HCA8_CHINA|nr:hypothetical protein CLV51_107176 [Chitinophaga niastensis]
MKQKIEKKLSLSKIKISRLNDVITSDPNLCPTGRKTCIDVCGTVAATIISCNTTTTL